MSDPTNINSDPNQNFTYSSPIIPTFYVPIPTNDSNQEQIFTKCQECKGSGKYIGLFKIEDCLICKGKGEIPI